MTTQIQEYKNCTLSVLHAKILGFDSTMGQLITQLERGLKRAMADAGGEAMAEKKAKYRAAFPEIFRKVMNVSSDRVDGTLAIL